MMCADDYLLVTAKTINEVFRVLKTNGKYIVISYSADRKYLFERKCLDFDIK
jgi:ubiquinone/menaquinone biosynthesis C-methylase UbiE